MYIEKLKAILNEVNPAVVTEGITSETRLNEDLGLDSLNMMLLAVQVEDAQIAEKILSSVGRVRCVNENLLDAVTGLSGSGPAYVMEFIMGLADGGVFCGLPRDAALELAIQTVLGTAVMCRENPAAIAALRDAVISPGGTTACGIRVLQEGAFKGLTAHAVIAGAEKSADLGKKQ